MELFRIDYSQDGTPTNLPNDSDDILLYGMDGVYAEGPVLGHWDSTMGVWSDQQYGELSWSPIYFAVPPKNPLKSFLAPTVCNEVV